MTINDFDLYEEYKLTIKDGESLKFRNVEEDLTF